MKTKETDYVVVTQANWKQVAQQLKSKGGAILIFEPGHRSFAPNHIIDTTLDLFQGCKLLNPREVQASWAKDWVEEKTGSQAKKQGRDRDYWLRKKDQPRPYDLWDHISDTIEGLALPNHYSLQIGHQSVVCRGYLDKGSTTCFIPRSADMRPCFDFALTSMVRVINKQARERKEIKLIGEEHIPRIIDYILLDLKTGEVMRKNLEHGQMADALLGM